MSLWFFSRMVVITATHGMNKLCNYNSKARKSQPQRTQGQTTQTENIWVSMLMRNESMSGCKIPCIDKTQVYIRITPYPWQCWKNMQGNKRVGLGSGWELPDTLRVYSYGSGLLLQWDIACYKLAENDNTPSRHITIFIRSRHIYYGSVWNLFVGFMDIAHASCTHLVIQTYFTRRSRFIVEELGLWSFKISWYTLAI